MVTRGVAEDLLAKVLIPYTVLETQGEVERLTGVQETEIGLAGIGFCGTEGVLLNVAAAALAEILLNNITTGGMGLDGLLGLALGINRAQLAAVR